jgi:hypothetical protein
MKRLILFLVFVIGCAQTIHGEPISSAWCVVNPDSINLPSFPTGSLERVADNNVHIVKQSQQSEEIQRLRERSVIEISQDDAEYFGAGIVPRGQAGRRIYLARASAFYLNEDYSVNDTLEVYMNSESKTLMVASFALVSRQLSPRNFAIIVETEEEVIEVLVLCHAAA